MSDQDKLDNILEYVQNNPKQATHLLQTLRIAVSIISIGIAVGIGFGTAYWFYDFFKTGKVQTVLGTNENN